MTTGMIVLCVIQVVLALLLGANMNLNGTSSRSIGSALGMLCIGMIGAAFVAGGWKFGLAFLPGTLVLTFCGFLTTTRFRR